MSLAWRSIVDRVTLHPAWPLTTHLDLVTSGIATTLTCIISTLDARAALSPDACLSQDFIDVRYAHPVPVIGTYPEPLREVVEFLRVAAHHELNEFLLVHGKAAAPPHEGCSTASIPVLNGSEAWQTACEAVSLHAAWKLDLILSANEDARHNVRMTCTLLNDGGTNARWWTFSRIARTPDAHHVQQLLSLVRHAIGAVLEDCIIVDGAPLSADFRLYRAWPPLSGGVSAVP